MTQNRVDNLFVEPLVLASKVDLAQPVVSIIIDALDEYHRNHVYGLYQHLSRIIDGQELPSNVKIIVTFRAGDDINPNLELLIQQHTAWRIYLDTDDKTSIEDLEKYIKHQFDDIMDKINRKRRSSRLTPLDSTCLGETQITDLRTPESGLFLWAKTTTVFVYERLENDNSTQNMGRIFTLLKGGHHKTVR